MKSAEEIDSLKTIEKITTHLGTIIKAKDDEIAKLKRQLEVAVESLTRESEVLGGFLDARTPECIARPSLANGASAMIELLHCYKRSTRDLAQIERIGEGKE